jgi:hypothetical protein
MTRTARLLVPAMMILSCGSGCASPIAGRWTRTASAGGAQLTSVEEFDASGAAVITLTGNSGCTGTIEYAGLTWTATATQIIFAGHAACSGTVNCSIAGTAVVIDCVHAPNGPQDGACDYSLSADQNSLTISNCSGTFGGSTTYTRAPN